MWQGLPARSHSSDNSGVKQRKIGVRSGVPLGAWSYSYADFMEPVDVSSSTGYDLPGYHRRLRKGELLPITPWLQDESYLTQNFLYNLKYSSGGVVQYEQDCAWTPCPSLSPVSDASIDLKLYDASAYVQAAAARIYSSGWDALTFIGELGQAIRMFQNIGIRVAAYGADIVKKGLVEKPLLELRYGWRTLIYDLKDLEKVLSNLDDHRQRFRESVGTTLSEQNVELITWGLGGAGSATVSVTDDYKIGLRGTVVADIEPPKFAFNPVVTGWELVPFSFVIDWFLGVGRWLASLSFLALQSQHFAAAGWQITVERTAIVTGTNPSANWSINCSGSANGRRVFTKRTPTTIPLSPLVQVNLNVSKVLDVLALILTRVLPGTRTKFLRQVLSGAAVIPSNWLSSP
jgi:hypothetical protein